MITRDRAIYEPPRLSKAEADFSRRYPEFDPDGTLAKLRRLEYARLDEGGQFAYGWARLDDVYQAFAVTSRRTP